ncbi:MAG: 1-acyl-sn-glycerol-3-phosphate acyltransferase [Candidatus Omnitrophica bacterium]|nr:1-acyl-sn-glycerol-3-phosphate acyltransferase [Candidatus Omnitrophota bacterium]
MSKRKHHSFDVARSLISWSFVGIVTIVFFFPVFLTAVILFPFDRNVKQMHPIASLWAKAILLVCPLMRIHVEGEEHLEHGKTYVLVANHQSLADIITVLHLNHPFKFVAKQELFLIPFMGWALWFAGYIPLIRGDQKSGKEAVKHMSRYLKHGVSILLFPEGTRSRDGEIHDFKVGAFKLAVEEGVPVVPIVIQGTRDLIPKGSLVIGDRVEVTMKVGKPRLSSQKEPGSIESFCRETRTEMIETLKKLRTQRGGG